ncbi:diphthine--ammonia ligase [Aquimarina sp. 2201CG14-23]|uniref:Dph6-related ATP pyrophosphatase n=1 Tax=Aquimarina mycalae TaxID=3040073 RepID=UPI002477EDA3|nr:diphthine--ammonia ligase [Aquimarina sp. 2201CG14-23]MDH7445594.1 diphthine--ammonia ligase [Aquimarina sp. 2201CG14-23]
MHKTYFNWSSGKDSSVALYYVLQQDAYKITKLLTTVNKDFERVSMHGLRESLLDLQVASLNLPIKKIKLPADVSMSSYNEAMKDNIEELKDEGYTHCVFGDIFLEDLRKYREDQLDSIGIKGVFPLWKRNTKELFLEFINLGFKAITVCVNAKYLDESFCGRILDESFLEDLPENVDPCGENGEFHTFVFDGPIFNNPIRFKIGEKVLRNYQPSKDDNDNCFTNDNDQHWDTSFWYCDLVPC